MLKKDDPMPEGTCPYFLKPSGCNRGGMCDKLHPATYGRCLRCGSEKHQVARCDRERRDMTGKGAASKAKPGAVPSNAAAKPPPGPKRAPNNNSASIAWAEGEGETSGTANVLEVSASLQAFVVTDSSEVLSSSNESYATCPIGDTGACHFLLPLSRLSHKKADSAQRIHMKALLVAAGKNRRALLHEGVVYATSVLRPLVPIGRLREALGLMFSWLDVVPVMKVLDEGSYRTLFTFS
eukprot:2146644-Amphidinium_carterae.1